MLTKLHENDFDKIYKIMEEGFPPSERRSKEEQRKLLKLAEYNVFGLKEEDDVIGFIAEWDGPEYRFVEHFAVNEEFHGQGIGSKLIMEYNQLSDKPVVLEVEVPEDDIQKKRVKFYKRNGYQLTDHSYVQPPLQEGAGGEKLVLMSYPVDMSEDDFLSVKEWLFVTVYS